MLGSAMVIALNAALLVACKHNATDCHIQVTVIDSSTGNPVNQAQVYFTLDTAYLNGNRQVNVPGFPDLIITPANGVVDKEVIKPVVVNISGIKINAPYDTIKGSTYAILQAGQTTQRILTLSKKGH